MEFIDLKTQYEKDPPLPKGSLWGGPPYGGMHAASWVFFSIPIPRGRGGYDASLSEICKMEASKWNL